MRPRVITHNSASVDGRLSLSPGVLLMFDERWPTYPGATYAGVQQRYQPDVILEGSGSLVTDDAEPTPLPPATEPDDELLQDFLPHEVVSRISRWLVVVDGRGRIRWLYKEYPGEQWQGWHVLVLVATSTPRAYLAYLRREAIPYLVAGDERVDLAAALEALQERLGVRTVVSTAGGRLNGALLRAGLVDEIEIEIVPIAVGGTHTPSLFTATDLGSADSPVALRLRDVEARDDGRVRLHYEVAGDV